MDLKLTLALCMIFALNCSLCKGQSRVLLYVDYIFTFAYHNATFQEASDICYDDHNGALLKTSNNKVLQNYILKQNRDLFKVIWVDDAVQVSDSYYAYEDDSSELQNCMATTLNGSIAKENCTRGLPYVCQIEAWMDEKYYMGSTYTFSNAKLRYADARKMCQDKNNRTTDNIATIESEQEQNFINEVTQNISEREGGNEFNYFIDINAGAYKNWITDESQVSVKGDICIRMSGKATAMGKWSNVSCNDYNHFICKWSIQDESTTAVAENEFGTTTIATTGAIVAIQNEGQTTLGTTEVNTVGTELPNNTKATTTAENNPVDMDTITVSARKQGGGIESTSTSGIATLLPSIFSVYMSAILILISN